MALAANSVQYTPPRHVCQMEHDLCMLPRLWANEGDLILTPDGIVGLDGQKASLNAEMQPMPWGWNKAVRRQFIRVGVAESMLPTDDEIDFIRQCASRKWAAQYAVELYQNMGESRFVVPNHMSFCTDAVGVDSWMAQHEGMNYIVKSEYSSSGRGNSINHLRSGQLLIDCFYDKQMDFAMEFEVTDHDVSMLGFSVFNASREGKYAFNHLKSQDELCQMIVQQLPPDGARHLDKLAETHKSLLRKHLLGRYCGIVGIDMMVVAGGRIHPCVEINLRMNMGVVAILLHEKGATNHDCALIGGDMFRPVIEEDRFFIKS